MQPAGGLDAALRQGAAERFRPFFDFAPLPGLLAEGLQPERQPGAAEFRRFRLPAAERLQRLKAL